MTFSTCLKLFASALRYSVVSRRHTRKIFAQASQQKLLGEEYVVLLNQQPTGPTVQMFNRDHQETSSICLKCGVLASVFHLKRSDHVQLIKRNNQNS